MSSRHRRASLTCDTRSRMTSTSHAGHAIRQRLAQADPLPHASGKRRGHRWAPEPARNALPGVTPATPAEGEPWSSSDHARRTARTGHQEATANIRPRAVGTASGRGRPSPGRVHPRFQACAASPAQSANGGRRALRPAALASARQWSAYGQGSAPSPDGYAAPRAVRRRSPSGHWVPDSDVIVLVPELMDEATRRGDRLDREAIFGAA
jgi:hypothetical protein